MTDERLREIQELFTRKGQSLIDWLDEGESVSIAADELLTEVQRFREFEKLAEETQQPDEKYEDSVFFWKFVAGKQWRRREENQAKIVKLKELIELLVSGIDTGELWKKTLDGEYALTAAAAILKETS